MSDTRPDLDLLAIRVSTHLNCLPEPTRSVAFKILEQRSADGLLRDYDEKHGDREAAAEAHRITALARGAAFREQQQTRKEPARRPPRSAVSTYSPALLTGSSVALLATWFIPVIPPVVAIICLIASVTLLPRSVGRDRQRLLWSCGLATTSFLVLLAAATGGVGLG